VVSLRGRETWLFITLPDFYASAWLAGGPQ
jgi:hypothetical protein